MRLDFSNFWQLQTLGYAVIVGILLCLSYDLVRFFNRLIRPSTFVLAIIDIVYWVYAAIVSFCFFMLFSKGVIRLYAYAGFFAGFGICRITLSKLFMLMLNWLQGLLKIIYKWITVPINYIGKFIQLVFDKICKIISRIKKSLEIFKKFNKINKKVVKKP